MGFALTILQRRLASSPEAIYQSLKRRHKRILFTEHKDTLNYLAGRIRDLLGSEAAVVLISGSTKREDRRRIQEELRNDPDALVLVATDAAGEGVNLQNANLMVNYDPPWNPNRIEQRFGRIHRIGQTEVCHLWSMVASQTRGGDVFQRLLDKLEQERQSLGGRVFDILVEVFENRSLKDLLVEAIRYGDQPEVRARLFHQVEGALDADHLNEIIRRNALSEEVMTPERLADVLGAGWIGSDLEARALAHAVSHLVPEHLAEVKQRRELTTDKCGWDITSRTPDHDVRFIEVKGRARSPSPATRSSPASTSPSATSSPWWRWTAVLHPSPLTCSRPSTPSQAGGQQHQLRLASAGVPGHSCEMK